MQLTNLDSNRKISLSDAEHRLCARVARLYYESGLNQGQIAEFLGLSRMKVNRLISLASKSGVVKIEIIGPDEPHAELENALCATFRLKDAKVVSSPLPEQSLRPVLAAAAADWLAERLEPGLVTGIGLGRTLALMPETFAVSRRVGCLFVTLEGAGVSPHAGFASYDVTSRLAEAAGGKAEIISTPTFVSAPAIRDALITEPSISTSLQVARGATLMMQSVGSVTPDALLYRHGTLTEKDLSRLEKAGAVGDALGHFFDANGEHIRWWTDEVHIGLTLDDVKKCPTSVVIAGGEDKLLAIRGGIRGGFINTVITDAATAERLLELGQ